MASPESTGKVSCPTVEAVVYFLTASEFVTGQLMAVDGGLSLR